MSARSSDTLSMPRIALIAALLALLAPFGANASSARGSTSAGPAAAKMKEMPTLEVQALAAVNRFRQSHGLNPLRLNPALSLAALDHSESMAKYGFFGHESRDGSAFWHRIRSRYGPVVRGRWSVGENLVWAAPQLSAGRALAMWVSSPLHLENLLKRGWREIGLGAVRTHAAPGVFQGLNATILTADFGVR